MNWELVVSGFAHSAVGGAVLMTVGCLAVLVCRQPIRRIRLIELTLAGALAVPIVSQAPWLPRLSIGVLPATADIVARSEVPAQPDSQASNIEIVAAVEPPLATSRAEPIVNSPHIDPQPSTSTTDGAPTISIVALLTAGYGIIVAGLLACYVYGICRLIRLYRATSPAPPDVEAAFRSIAGPAGKSVVLRSSDTVELPIAFRGWRPIIVLPTSLCSEADSAALRFSLAHEWSHIEGGDVSRWYWTSLAQFLYFFHPLFWWMRRQLRLCQDYLADARAAEQAKNAGDYAEYLVAISRRRTTTPAATLGIGDVRSNLYRRIIMLLQPQRTLERRCVRTWIAGAFFVGLAVLFACSSIRLNAGDPPPAKGDAKAETKDDPFKDASISKEKAETLNYTGRVVDKDTGKPISGVTVTVRRSLYGDPQVKAANQMMEESKHTTDADGKYSFVIPPEQTSKRYLYIELDVEHPDYAPQSNFGYALSMIRKNEKVGSRPFFEHIEMRAGKAITGTMRTVDGQPVVGAKVQAYSVTNKRGNNFEYGSFANCKTDANGQFRLVVTTPGTAVFWLLPENHAPSVHRVPEEKRGDLGSFTVEAGIPVKGTVYDVRGKPLPGILVNASHNNRGDELEGLMVANQLRRSAVTNDKGEFTMKPLPPGEIEIVPGTYAEDGSGARDKRYVVPGVFLRQKVVIKESTPALEIRAVPHVVFEAQYYDSKGKKSRGHESHIFGQLDKSYWFGEAKVDVDGKMTAMIPHGLENVRVNLMTNEHGALRHRLKKDDPLKAGREINLGTMNDDVLNVEIVHYKAPMLVINAVDKDKKQIKGFKPQVVYKAEANRQKEGVQFVNGLKGDVYLQKQGDGRYHTSQLLPDEDLTITVSADDFESKTMQLTLPEGDVREVELVMEPKEKK